MDYKEQLIDSGAVIGYRPDIRIYKKDQIDGDVPQEDGIIILPSSPSYSSYSKTVQRYIKSSPATILASITETLDLCNEVIDSLANEFNSKGFPKYSNIDRFIKSLKNDTAYTNKFLNAMDTVDGSIIPSVIKTLTEQKELLNKVRSAFSILNYGKDINDNAAKEKDEFVIKRITMNDLAGSGNNIALLYMDTKFNRCIQIYTENMEEVFLTYSDIPLRKFQDMPVGNNNSFCKYLDSVYENLTTKQDKLYSVYNDNHLSKNTAIKSMYNYHSVRNIMDDFYSSITELEYPGEYLINIGNQYYGNVEDALKDVVKTFLANGTYINRIENILLEKQNLICIKDSMLQ